MECLIIIIIIRHQLGLNRPVSASSNSLYKGLPSRLRPFGLQFNTIFRILQLFVLVTCRSQFDFYLLCFPSAGSTVNSSKIPSFLVQSYKVYRAVILKKIISIYISLFLSLVHKGTNIAHVQKNDGSQCIVYMKCFFVFLYLFRHA